MIGIHDMGGMEGMGELGYEVNEPTFHAEWEGRVLAIHAATRVYRRGPLRPTIEIIPAKDYLRMSYYERWLMALIGQVIERGLATRAEIERGNADAGSEKATPALTLGDASETLFRTPQSELDIEVEERFQVGERVRVRNLHSTTHTRMPRYTRGRVGIVERDRGVFALPDNEVYFLDPKPQHVYLVRFTARELWGEEAPEHDKLYLDMWEDYLEPA
jgi:nitrile hydratase beta subunit